jgi:hypothetical protein
VAGPAVVFPYFSLDRGGKSGVLRVALSSAKTRAMHAALVFELSADHQVKIKMGHTNRLLISIRMRIYHRATGSPIETELIKLILFMCSISAFRFL